MSNYDEVTKTDSDHKLRKAGYLLNRYDVSEMTLWRWVNQGLLARPIRINRRRYWTDQQISDFEARFHEAA